ncbi:unnamed protein product [Discosporangium mesarthrocarpum]
MSSGFRQRSPFRSRYRDRGPTTPPKRRNEVDLGQDAEQQFRHIARVRVLNLFSEEKGVSRAWPWVLQALSHRRSGRGYGCPIDLLDTIICDDEGVPESLFFTGREGVFRRVIGDDDGCITFSNAIAQLQPPKRYRGYLESIGETRAVVCFSAAGDATPLESNDLKKIRLGQAATPAGMQAFVRLVPTKVRTAEFLLSFQQSYHLEPGSGKAIHRTFRLVVVQGQAQRVICKSITTIKRLRNAGNEIIEWLESNSGARVLCLGLEYVEDALGDLWLVRSSECVMTPAQNSYSHFRRSPSPSQSKVARQEECKGIANELALLRYGHALGETAPPDTLHPPGPSPAGSCRPHTATSLAAGLEQMGTKGSLSSLDAEEWGLEGLGSPSEALRAQRPHTTSICRSEQLAKRRENLPEFKGFMEPGEQNLRSVAKTPAMGRALGSSQLQGMCHGDFCDVELPDKVEQSANFEHMETGKRSDIPSSLGSVHGAESALSPLHQRFMRLGEATLEDQGVLGVPQAFQVGGSQTSSTSIGRKGKQRREKRGRDGRSWGRNEDKKEPEQEQASKKDWSEVPRSWVVRGRQERHLIEQQLRRYHRGEAGEYTYDISGLADSSLPIGAAYPAVFYESLRVCRNCHRVYTIVEEARTRAVAKIKGHGVETGHLLRGAGKGGKGRKGKKRARAGEGLGVEEGGAEKGRGPETGGESILSPDIGTEGDSLRGHQPATTYQEGRAISQGRGDGRELGEDGDAGTSLETEALGYAQAAINGLTRGDICELRSFLKPPPAVNMAVAALMIILTGSGEPSPEGWAMAKHYMTDVDKVYRGIMKLDPASVRTSQARKIEAYARNPLFRPEVLECISLPASKLCGWVLGVLEAYRWRTGKGHERITTLGPKVGWLSSINALGGGRTKSPALAEPSNGCMQPSVQPPMPSIPGDAGLSRPMTTVPRSTLTAGSGYPRSSSPTRDKISLGPPIFPLVPQAEQPTSAQRRKRSKLGDVLGNRNVTAPFTTAGEYGGESGAMRAGGEAKDGAGSKGVPSLAVCTRTRLDQVPPPPTDTKGDRLLVTRAQQKERQVRQRRLAKRLSDAEALPKDPSGFERHTFMCGDRVTQLPYAVAGTSTSGARAVSIVAVHDFFDTLEKTFLLLKPLILQHRGCQVLCFNTPGQAGTSCPSEPEGLATNVWVADRMNELLQHVDNMGEMSLSNQPFHLLGIGNGAIIAAAFACRHGKLPRWRPTLRTLICINGFAFVDAQLAAVLHSAQGAIQCFPPERPDLPITFWSRFIFGADYIKTIGMSLALNIYCAVANPMGAAGMLKVIGGALHHQDLRKDIQMVEVPLVLVQSTENILVNPANVDPFLEGRKPRHLWSHQLRLRPEPTKGNTCLGPQGEAALAESIGSGSRGAFVTWVKGGHEVRQECKRVVTDVLGLLVAPMGQPDGYFQRGVMPPHSPRPHQQVGLVGGTGKTVAQRGAGDTNRKEGGAVMGEGASVRVSVEKGLQVSATARNGHGGRQSDSRDGGKDDVFGADGNDMEQERKSEERQERHLVSDGGEKSVYNALSMKVARTNGRHDRWGERIEPWKTKWPYQYHSLRKIQLEDPTPQLPRRADRADSTLLRRPRNHGKHPKPIPRATTAPFPADSLATRRHLRGQAGTSRPAEGEGQHGEDEGGYKPIPEEESHSGVELENAVADFEGALLEHRRRRINGMRSSPNRELGAREGAIGGGEDMTLAREVFAEEQSLGERPSTVAFTPETETGQGKNLESWLSWAQEGIDDIGRGGSSTRGDFGVSRIDGENLPDILDAVMAWPPSSTPQAKTIEKGLVRLLPTSEAVSKEVVAQDPAPSKKSSLPHALGPTIPIAQAPAQQTEDRSRKSQMSVGDPAGQLKREKTGLVHEFDNALLSVNSTEATGLEANASQESARACDSSSPTPFLDGKVVFTGEQALDHTSADSLGDGERTSMPSTDQEPPLSSISRIPVVSSAHASTSMTTHTPPPISAEEINLRSTKEQRSARNWLTGTGVSSVPEETSAADAACVTAKVTGPRTEQKTAVVDARNERTFGDRVGEERERGGDSSREWGTQVATVATEMEAQDESSGTTDEGRLTELTLQAELVRLQRGAEFEEIDAAPQPRVPVRGMRPQHYDVAVDLPQSITHPSGAVGADNVLDEMEDIAARAKNVGLVNLEEYEAVERQLEVRQLSRVATLQKHTSEEREKLFSDVAQRIQRLTRGYMARKRVGDIRAVAKDAHEKSKAAARIQALARGCRTRAVVMCKRHAEQDNYILGGRATHIQRVFRGHLGRTSYMARLRDSRCRRMQKAVRGFLGRRECVAFRKRQMLQLFVARSEAIILIQSIWRGKVARDDYIRTRSFSIASREIQRLYRGHIGRRAAKRKREWETTPPGPQRLKMGLRMIEDTKVVAFEKQQGEIAALHRAQEKAEARVSSIHHQLKTSESELGVLEGELTKVDQLERDLVQLTHERDLLQRGITGAVGIPKTGEAEQSGGEAAGDDDEFPRGAASVVRMKADAYALEMQIQIKRAEREQRRQQLAAEFASTFAEVEEKRQQLQRLSSAVVDIESTRQRKAREFGVMQRNLMGLLSEQKRELDNMREKGVQLEVAAATSAAAAAATAQRARDHEERSASMFSQTEELMKFQFMSMSLSYFSSLNMMKQIRTINADTTTSAVAGSADAAAAAAAASAAACVPSLKQAGLLEGIEVGGGAIAHQDLALAIRQKEVKTMRTEMEEAAESQRHPFPPDITLWTVEDVCRWLDTLQLGEYKQAFQEGKVDGSFLVELRESDLMDSIGMEHRLHLKKLLLAREKLTPLSTQEQAKKKIVLREEGADAVRAGIPEPEAVFSQARHGKKKRLEESLNMGMDIEHEDENGNTLLLAATQQNEMAVVEMLIKRGANVNHANAAGNTSLHYAMAYDPSGRLGEFLINNGADDSAENKDGLTPCEL